MKELKELAEKLANLKLKEVTSLKEILKEEFKENYPLYTYYFTI